MNKNVKSVAILVAICTVVALLLAVTNQFTAPIIEKNNAAAANAALLEVMPEGTGFEKIEDISKLPASVTEAHKETSGKGYVIQLSVTGYGTNMVIMCGVDADNKVTGAVCLSSNETLGKEKEYGKNFADKDAAAVEATDTIGGATMTTSAYKNAVKDALNAVLILGGADVDVRTPEQILQDNLNEALPNGGTFNKVFLTEVIEGIDAIYQGNGGYVAVIGETFIGTDVNGKVLDAGVENTAAIEAEMGKVISSLSTSNLIGVDLTAYEGINKNVQKVQKTASGNYIVEIHGLGYAYYDDNHGYGEQRFVPIVIRASLTPEGKIIDTLTVSHEESKGFGAVCGEESYYGQFDGKTAETYTEVDGIAGATMTTDGYMKAIQRCFETVSILEGGAQ